jgi:hypothetical protein
MIEVEKGGGLVVAFTVFEQQHYADHGTVKFAWYSTAL